MSNRQFGFFQDYSTTLAVSIIYDANTKNIDNDLHTCCLFLDLSKH